MLQSDNVSVNLQTMKSKCLTLKGLVIYSLHLPVRLIFFKEIILYGNEQKEIIYFQSRGHREIIRKWILPACHFPPPSPRICIAEKKIISWQTFFYDLITIIAFTKLFLPCLAECRLFKIINFCIYLFFSFSAVMASTLKKLVKRLRCYHLMHKTETWT